MNNKDIEEAIKRINNLVVPTHWNGTYTLTDCITTSGGGFFGAAPVTKGLSVPEIEKVIFNNPTTIVLWADGTKTIVRCGKDETFYEDAGLSAAVSKKLFGSRAAFLREVAKAERQLPKEDYKKTKKVKK